MFIKISGQKYKIYPTKNLNILLNKASNRLIYDKSLNENQLYGIIVNA